MFRTGAIAIVLSLVALSAYGGTTERVSVASDGSPLRGGVFPS